MSCTSWRRRHAPFALSLRTIAVAAALVALGPQHAGAQAPAAPTAVAAPASEQDLEQLVGRIALYPDDLVAVILPASTNPLQIVQADRLLDQRKSNPKVEVNAGWDDAVKTLCNYPEVVKMMSQDLDWTTALGEAVVADTGEVMEAVQAFRRRAQSAGNLKSDDKTKVSQDNQTITIVQADPQVIYVPQYNPETVVVQGGYPAYSYYPSPYPVYYYPYAPGAALATGIIWGAAMGAIWSGGAYVSHYGGGGNTINIDNSRNNNINRGNTNVGSGNRGNQATQWSSGKKPGDVSRTTGRSGNAQNRVGDRQAGAGGAGGVQNRAGAGGGAGAAQNRASNTQQMGNRGSGGAFDGAGSSARQTQLDSQRGAASRNSAGAGASRPAPSSRPSGGAGGARAGGGGGARGGGGGRGGGGRR